MCHDLRLYPKERENVELQFPFPGRAEHICQAADERGNPAASETADGPCLHPIVGPDPRAFLDLPRPRYNPYSRKSHIKQ